jgi:hypothetical protein
MNKKMQVLLDEIQDMIIEAKDILCIEARDADFITTEIIEARARLIALEEVYEIIFSAMEGE